MIPTREVNGKFYRFLTPKWAHRPTSGDGAIGEGGRFNPKGVPTLYLSADYATAWDEYNQPGRPLKPGTLVVYDVKASQIVDLTDPSTPVEIAVVDTPDFAWSLSVDADRTYVADGDSGLRVIEAIPEPHAMLLQAAAAAALVAVATRRRRGRRRPRD